MERGPDLKLEDQSLNPMSEKTNMQIDIVIIIRNLLHTILIYSL